MSHKNILISVIGKPLNGEYNLAKYEVSPGVVEESRFFFLPIVKQYGIDELFLLGTEDSIWDKIPAEVEYTKVIIPFGKSEDDQWEIFNTINELSIDDSNLYMDFTHGFRTMPFISLLSIFYIKVTKPSVKIKKILYGNYEGRDLDSGISPVIDLSGFLQIIDWLFAAKSFTKFGSGEELSALLKKFPDDNIKALQESISNINSAMQLAYMTELPQEFERMTHAFNKIDLDSLPAISPLKTIFPELSKLTRLIDYSAAEYEKQWSIADWYYKNNQIAKSIITLREAFVTYVGEMGGFALSSFNDRSNLAKEILNDTKLLKRADLQTFSNLWKNVRELRNNVGHPIFEASEKEDLKDKQRIQNWLYDSKQLFESLKDSKKLGSLFMEVRNKKVLREKPSHSLDDLRNKFKQ